MKKAVSWLRSLMKKAASWLHLPPTSSPQTTNLQRRLRRSSGHVSSFLRRASRRAAPAKVPPHCLGTPSRVNGDTRVVSTASLSSSHPFIFTSSHVHIFSHFFIFTSSHFHIYSCSHLHILTPSHPHIFSPSHPHIFTYSHHHILTSSHLDILFFFIFTFSHLHITFSRLLLFTCSHSLLLSYPLALSFFSISLLQARGSANETPRNATPSPEMKYVRTK